MKSIEGFDVIGVQQRPGLVSSPAIVESNSQLAL
jgi:hypothetical protein